MEIHVLGLGIDEPVVLGASGLALFEKCTTVFGSKAQLERVQAHCQPHHTCVEYQHFKDALEKLAAQKEPVLFLASGDGLFYGAGTALQSHFPAANMHFYPNVSTLQAVCARVGENACTLPHVSVHGKKLSRLKARLYNGAKLLVLTCPNNCPIAIAKLLLECQLEHSTVQIFECLGQANERISSWSVTDLASQKNGHFNAPNALLIHAQGPHCFLPPNIGIKDAHFIAPGKKMFSKQATRLHVLCVLQSTGRTIGWDIGAGYGALCLEWARSAPHTHIHAIEKNPLTFDILRQNQAKFGDHDNLTLHFGQAENTIAQWPDPNYIIIGGSHNAQALLQLLEICTTRLCQGGTLVTIAATEDTKYLLWSYRQKMKDKWHVEATLIHNAAETMLGQKTALKPGMPVLISTWARVE